MKSTKPGAAAKPGAAKKKPGRRPSRGFLLTLAGLAAAGAGYVAFERGGTSANADTVASFENFAGGFVAVGMTGHEPGFVVASALDEDDVGVHAQISTNALSGRHTTVRVKSPRQEMEHRLRSPLVIVVHPDGVMTSAEVGWSLGQFQELMDCMDCEKVVEGRPRRCGEPFRDMQEACSAWGGGVPRNLREFLRERTEAGGPASQPERKD